MKTRQRVFVDMDGVLAKFTPVDHLETLYEKGYFLDLEPQQKVIDAIRELVLDGRKDVYILSAHLSDSRFALAEKNEWLDRHLPEIPDAMRLFPPCGVSKIEWLGENGFQIGKSDVLLDDYSKNLHEWQKYGTGIKLLNGINGSHGSWQRDAVDMRDENLSNVLHQMIDRNDIACSWQGRTYEGYIKDLISTGADRLAGQEISAGLLSNQIVLNVLRNNLLFDQKQDAADFIKKHFYESARYREKQRDEAEQFKMEDHADPLLDPVDFALGMVISDMQDMIEATETSKQLNHYRQDAINTEKITIDQKTIDSLKYDLGRSERKEAVRTAETFKGIEAEI